MSSTTNQARIPELDGIRGIAIGTILLFHYVYLTADNVPGTLAAYLLIPGRLGWSGVDLFFVLSGFLIGGIILDSVNAPNFYRVFYGRRFLRIIPAYFLLLFLYRLLISVHVGARPLIPSETLPFGPYFLFLQNFWMVARSTLGYILSITWSLTIEEQFYLTLPLLICFVPRKRLAAVLVIGVGLAVLCRSALYFFLPRTSVAPFVLTPCRADALLLGVLCALIVRTPEWNALLRRNLKKVRVLLLILATGVVAMIQLMKYLGFSLMMAGGYTWLAAFFAVALLYSISDQASSLSRFLRWTWLRYLGQIAYGTYLLHGVVITVCFSLVKGGSPHLRSWRDALLISLSLAATFVICAASWHYFEKPLIRIGHRWQYAGAPPQITEYTSAADAAGATA